MILNYQRNTKKFMSKFKINNFLVNETSLPYVIAEIGVNHEGSFDKAKMLIELAKEGGANAAKFQTYKANTLASINSPHYWDLEKENTKSQFKLFQKYDCFEPDDYVKLAEHCEKINIDFMSTPFDHFSVDFLDPIMSAYKVASADITNFPLIDLIARKKKPIILSTGASNISEIQDAIAVIQKNGNDQIALLHCILNYPTKNEDANLLMIQGLKKSFPKYTIGYSDHTLPLNNMLSLTTAYILGARIIEKHFTYDKSLPGNDHYHAMDLNDLKIFRKNLDDLIGLIGNEKEAKYLPKTLLFVNDPVPA
jgi:sialic acid synthase SpsE